MSRAATSEYIGMKRRAYAHADRAVLAAYGLAPDTPEPEIVALQTVDHGKPLKSSQKGGCLSFSPTLRRGYLI